MKLKKQDYSRRITVNLTEQQFKLIELMRQKHNKNASRLIRESIEMYALYYTPIFKDK